GFQSMLKEYEAEVPKPESKLAFQNVESLHEASQLVKELSEQEKVYAYLDLDREEPMVAKPRFLALTGDNRGWIVRFDDSKNLGVDGLRDFWENSKIPKILHNAKTARVALVKEGISLQGIQWDTMLMSYLIQPNRSNHNLDEIGFARLERTPAHSPEHRCTTTRDLFAILLPELTELKLERVYEEIELPLVEVLATMEWNGIRVDSTALMRMSDEFDKQLNILTQKIYEVAGSEFNINSPRQLGEILFEKLNLPAPKKLKKSGQYSTSVEILEQLASEFELPRLMLEYRQLAKLKSGYVDALPRLVNPHTGRVHTSFNQ